MEELLADVNMVFHCAAIVSFDPKKAQQLIRDNTTITKNLVNACVDNKQIKKFIHISSVAALGRSEDINQKEIDEETQWVESKQNSNYAKSKYAAELEVWRGIAEGLPAVILNPSLILGENHWEHSSGKIIPTIYNEFPWFTDGINAWVDILDVIKVAYLLSISDIVAERFVICEGNYSFKEIFTKFAKAMNRRAPHKHAKRWMTEILWRLSAVQSFFSKKDALITRETARTAQNVHYYSNKKIKMTLHGFSFTPIENSIERIAKAYLKHINP